MPQPPWYCHIPDIALDGWKDKAMNPSAILGGIIALVIVALVAIVLTVIFAESQVVQISAFILAFVAPTIVSLLALLKSSNTDTKVNSIADDVKTAKDAHQEETLRRLQQ